MAKPNIKGNILDLDGLRILSPTINELQPKLVSGRNIATINGKDLTKGGDITIQGGGGDTPFSIDDETHLLAIDVDNPLRFVKETGGLTSSIRSWGFVGDSLSSGEIWGFRDMGWITLAERQNYKIDTNGNLVAANGYVVTEVMSIDTRPFVKLYFDTPSDLNGISVISTTNSIGSIYTPIKKGDAKTIRYQYSNNENVTTYVVFCYKADNKPRIHYTNKYHADHYDISWGQFLCRMTGSTGYNYSVGGETAKRFMTASDNQRRITRLLSDPQKQAYTIALGVNDSIVGGVGDVNSDINLEDYNLNADTFIGWYARIIQAIKGQFADSLIFIINIPEDDEQFAPKNIAIGDIYNFFKDLYPGTIFLIDLHTYASEIVSRYKVNGIHLTSQGYQYTAYQICTYIDWLFKTNEEAFSNVSFIGIENVSVNNPL